jgi:hypothetical protein
VVGTSGFSIDAPITTRPSRSVSSRIGSRLVSAYHCVPGACPRGFHNLHAIGRARRIVGHVGLIVAHAIDVLGREPNSAALDGADVKRDEDRAGCKIADQITPMRCAFRENDLQPCLHLFP